MGRVPDILVVRVQQNGRIHPSRIQHQLQPYIPEL